jgi:hypothetical protein
VLHAFRVNFLCKYPLLILSSKFFQFWKKADKTVSTDGNAFLLKDSNTTAPDLGTNEASARESIATISCTKMVDVTTETFYTSQ